MTASGAARHRRSTTIIRRRTASAIVVMLSVFAFSCASDTSTGNASPSEAPTVEAAVSTAAPATVESLPTATAQPTATSTAPDPTPEQPQSADQEFVTTVANKVLVSEGAALAVLLDENGDVVEASNGVDHNGQAPTSADTFRVGSITKVFTAIATLTLVEDGVIDLDAPAAQYLTRITVPAGITVRHLLQHTSGNADTPFYIRQLLEAPDLAWEPEETLEISLQTTSTEPDSQFVYASSNYLILGVLLEEVTGQSFATVIRERIIAPLKMVDTFVAEFEDGPAPFDPYVPLRGDEDADYDYTSLATASWSAGAIVSSASDLHTMFTALFDEQIVSAETIELMTANDYYGLGLRLWDAGLVGHDGFMFGYHTVVLHAPETGETAFFASTDEYANTRAASRAMIDGFVTRTEAPPN